MCNLTEHDRWLLYNFGCTQVDEFDLGLSELDWRGKYNTKWHNAASHQIQSRLRFLREEGFVKWSDANTTFVELTSLGVEEWKRIALPDFGKAYSWECQESTIDGFDYRISIAAPTLLRVLSVFAAQLNEGFFGLVQSESFVIDNNCDFSAVYWHRARGTRISFDAAYSKCELSKLKIYADHCQKSKRWYRPFS